MQNFSEMRIMNLEESSFLQKRTLSEKELRRMSDKFLLKLEVEFIQDDSQIRPFKINDRKYAARLYSILGDEIVRMIGVYRLSAEQKVFNLISDFFESPHDYHNELTLVCVEIYTPKRFRRIHFLSEHKQEWRRK